MAITERIYNVPLRKGFQKAPKYRRAKKAVNVLRAFLQKNMKTDDVLIGPQLNMKIWAQGIQYPPHHVKVTAIKDDKDNVARVELFGFEFKAKEKKEKKEKATGLAGKLQEKLGATEKKEEKAEDAKKEAPAKTEEKKEEKKTETKKEDKPAASKKTPVKKAEPKTEKKE